MVFQRAANGVGFEAEILAHLRRLHDLVEHLLPALGAVSDRPLAAAVSR
jgi:hypothetical protein